MFDIEAADVGDGVFVSSYRHCDRSTHKYDLVVHVWKPGQVSTGDMESILRNGWADQVVVLPMPLQFEVLSDAGSQPRGY